MTNNGREQYLERPLPSSDESERAILGGIILDNSLIEHAIKQLAEGDFYSPLHRRVYSAMLELHRQKKPIDPIIIGEELKKEGSLDAIGGVPTITNLTFGLPHFSNIDEYVEIVFERSRIRELIRECNGLISAALEDYSDARTVITSAQARINALAQTALTDDVSTGFQRLDRVIATDVKPALESLERGESQKIPTGLESIDLVLNGGISRSDLMILAGLPSSGKSALALQMGFSIASTGRPTAFLAGEMTNQENVFRILSQLSGMQNINSLTHIDRKDRDFLDRWADSISSIPLYLDYKTNDMQNLRVRLSAMVREQNIQVLILDYLQLFKMERVDKRTRFERISEVSQELKRLATELDIAVIAVSQFNRVGAKSGKPTMHDSDGASQIEKDASIYLIVDREPKSDDVTIRIEKGRNTGTGTINGKFYGRTVRFEF